MIFLTISACIAFLVSPLIIRFAPFFKLVDDPRRRYHPAHTHTGIIPRAGGIAIYLGIVLASLFFLDITKPIIGVLLGGTVVILTGVWDDYRDLSPYVRLILNGVAALLVVGFGAGIPYITNPFGGVIHLDTIRFSFELWGEHSILILSSIAGVIWIVWMMNAVGWSAGVDGQLPGFVAIACIVIALLSERFIPNDPSQSVVRDLALVTAGGFIGFLPWNFFPQKIMPGYGGKSLAGFMLAALSILSFVKVGTALLVLSVPFIDACYTVIRRISSGKSPFQADRGHLHHRLLDLGWGKRRIAFFYWGITLGLGIIALSFDGQIKAVAFLVAGVVIVSFLLLLQLLNFFRVLR